MKRQADAFRLRDVPHLVAHLWDLLFRPTPLLQSRLEEATEELNLSPSFLALHFRAGNESGRLWWDPSRHSLQTLPEFLKCAFLAEKELELSEDTPWFLSTDTLGAFDVPEVADLISSKKLRVLGDGWHLAHVDRSHANLGLQGFLDSYVSYLLLSKARALVLSRSFFGETAAEIGAVPHVYFAEGCVRTDIRSS